MNIFLDYRSDFRMTSYYDARKLMGSNGESGFSIDFCHSAYVVINT